MRAVKTTDPKEHYINEISKVNYMKYIPYIIELNRDSEWDTQDILDLLRFITIKEFMV